jgi:adenylosuccinate synthase
MKTINNVDVVYGASWGDEGKGKITHFLASKPNYYNFVCRWNGGSNAGHTIFHNGKKFATHIVPSGIFYGIKSVIGPNCVVNIESFYKEVAELSSGGLDTSLIKIHPLAHIVTNEHIEEDKAKLAHLGTTSQGIAPAYRDKAARKGLLAKDSTIDKSYILNEELHGNILCEGAQGYHLDINYGNYPFITSSECLPYGACSLGFPPQKIKNVFACAKIYDTRSGTDPLFPETLLEDPILLSIADAGKEYGTTTGRRRKVNWLNMDKLIEAIRVGGATHLVINKCDILKQVGIYKVFHEGKLIDFKTFDELQDFIDFVCYNSSDLLEYIYFSENPETIEGFEV